jgi:Cys-tRNA(Pro)/Cys-tRNA(Cys) deacylase
MAGRETPATRAAKAAGIEHAVHEYVHDPAADSYALEAAEALGLDPARVFKTLVVSDGGASGGEGLTVCIVPAGATLDLKAVGKRAAMAPTARAERVTGYVAGGISPLGQRRALPTLVDDSATAHRTIFVSAGRRGLELELAPGDLVALTCARVRRLRRP